MKTIEYFKLQSKNLYKDFQTQKPYFDSIYRRDFFEYSPKYFDVDTLILDFDIDEHNFTLMNAQHYIASLAGFRKWTEMLKASPAELELSKLLFDNMHKISVIEWDVYLSVQQNENGYLFDDEFKLDIFRTIFDQVDGHQSDGYDYRLSKKEKRSIENQIIKPKKMKATMQIKALPLVGEVRTEFIKTANLVFEKVLQRIEAEHPQSVVKMWNPENYIDEILLGPEMLPIDHDYALSLIDAFMVHHVIELASDADSHALN